MTFLARRSVDVDIVLEPGLALPAVVGVVHAASGPARSVDSARQPGAATTLDPAAYRLPASSGPVTTNSARLPDAATAVGPAAHRPPASASYMTNQAAARRLPVSVAPTPVCDTQFAALRTDVVHTSVETLTAQSLLLLGRRTATPASTSRHSSVHQWLQCTEPMGPPPSSVVSARSSDHQEGPPTLPMGADAAMLEPRAVRLSRVSHATRRTRRTATSSMAAEILGFLREMSSHMLIMTGQMQAQAQAQFDQSQNQISQILAQAEIQRLDAKERERAAEEVSRKREEAQKAEALTRHENNSAREQLLVQLKIEADKNNAEREKMQAELNLSLIHI